MRIRRTKSGDLYEVDGVWMTEEEYLQLPYTRRKTKVTFYNCPHCGGRQAVPVMYGYPMDEACQLRSNKVIDFGGCCVGKKMPNRSCFECGTQWVAKEGDEPGRVEEVTLEPLPPPPPPVEGIPF